MFSESQLARALIAAREQGIPAVVGLNKTDLPAAAAAREKLAPYRAMGVEVIELALKGRAGDDAARLRQRLTGRTTLVMGPSGAGKSTLINLLVPDAAAAVGEISTALGTGRHTTTSTRWYALPGAGGHGGAIIDSPGFQQFGLRHVGPERLASLMPDLAPHLGSCRFHNCTHRHEPGCAVREAAARGEIAPSRLRLYEELHAELSAPPRY
jgi:ribosome biogenesis GTPase